MDIQLKEIRIKNFRSIHDLDVELNSFNLLIGKNNTGKSNFIESIYFGLSPYNDATINDIYWERDEIRSKTKEAIIDIKITPSKSKEFSDFWSGVFTTDRIMLDEEIDYVGIRTKIVFDNTRNDYIVEKYIIKEWNKNIDESKIGKKKKYNEEMIDYLNVFFLDALRDFSKEMKNKKSYFNKSLSIINLSSEEKENIETKLNEINEQILNSVDTIKETSETISDISTILSKANGKAIIEPLARSIDDLQKGLDVVIDEGVSEKFSVSEYGMGTKSWLSFLGLKAYENFVINHIIKLKEDSDIYEMLLLEEPEAHLHPQAQKSLYNQLNQFEGQKVISTHSPQILSQCDLDKMYFFTRNDCETIVKRIDPKEFEKQELNKIRRELLKSKGELFFSNCVILCEGITEEITLPIYFEKYFNNNMNYYGITIISVGGVNYSMFIKVLNMLGIKWFILSDSEDETLKTLQNVLTPKDNDLNNVDNLIHYGNKDCIESYLIRSGYSEEIKKAISALNNENYYEDQLFKNPIRMQKNKSTGEICPKCHQDIKVSTDIDKNELTEEEYKLFKFITRWDGKTKYCEEIANQIINSNKPLPEKFVELFKKIQSFLNIPRNEENNNEN